MPLTAPLELPPIALAKPAHLAIIIGEPHHVSHFMPLLRRELGHEAIGFGLRHSIAVGGPALIERVQRIDTVLRQSGDRYGQRVFLSKDVPPCLVSVELLLSHIPDKVSVLVLETDWDRFEREISPMPRKRVEQIKASFEDFQKKARPLLSQLEVLRRAHPHSVSVIEHRRSIRAQVSHAHHRIAIKTGRKGPACS